jgi:Arc/MetJ family transcription regulator
MRTTLDLPDELVNEAMTMTRSKTKTDLIKTALKNIIQKEKSKSIQQYFGKVDLDIDLDTMRKR